MAGGKRKNERKSYEQIDLACCSPLRALYAWLHKADWQLIPGTAYSCSPSTTMLYTDTYNGKRHTCECGPYIAVPTLQYLASLVQHALMRAQMRRRTTKTRRKKKTSTEKYEWQHENRVRAFILRATMRFSKRAHTHTHDIPFRSATSLHPFHGLLSSTVLRSICAPYAFVAIHCNVVSMERLPPRITW